VAFRVTNRFLFPSLRSVHAILLLAPETPFPEALPSIRGRGLAVKNARSAGVWRNAAGVPDERLNGHGAVIYRESAMVGDKRQRLANIVNFHHVMENWNEVASSAVAPQQYTIIARFCF